MLELCTRGLGRDDSRLFVVMSRRAKWELNVDCWHEFFEVQGKARHASFGVDKADPFPAGAGLGRVGLRLKSTSGGMSDHAD